MNRFIGFMTADGATPDEAYRRHLSDALQHDLAKPSAAHIHAGQGVVLAALEATPSVFVRRAADYLLRDMDTQMPSQSDSGAVDDCGYATAEHRTLNQTIHLTRDPFGKKSLYFIEDSRGFAFASDPTILRRAGFGQGALSPEAQDELLQLQFVTGRDTVFPGIQRVLPGEQLTVSFGRIVERRHTSALTPEPLPEQQSDLAVDGLLQRLEDWQSAHVSPHTPFIYTGTIADAVCLESFAPFVAAEFASRLPVLVPVYADSPSESERTHLEHSKIAQSANVVPCLLNEEAFWHTLPDVVDTLDDPVADYNAVVAFFLLRQAHQQSTTAILSAGAPEIFAARGRYRSYLRPWYLGGPKALHNRGRFDGMHLLRRQPTAWRDGIRALESLTRDSDLSLLQKAQWVDCQSWLPHDILLSLDRGSQATGVKILLPYLNHDIAREGFALPDQLKVQGRSGARILTLCLKRLADPEAPLHTLTVPPLPVAEWLNAAAPRLAPLVARQPGIQEIAYPDRVLDIFRSRRKRAVLAAWSLLFYALWHRKHVLSANGTGNVFERLAAA